jgi:hypothetical protein
MALADLPSLDVLRGETFGPVQRSGDEAGGFDQHAGVAAGAGHQGQIGKGDDNNFRFVFAKRETNNNNVNRRFAGRELKFAVAAADDETTERKVIWLTFANIVEELSKLTVSKPLTW